MNLLQPNANEATQTANRSRSVVPTSGLCTRCIDGCAKGIASGTKNCFDSAERLSGNCDPVWLHKFLLFQPCEGRQLITQMISSQQVNHGFVGGVVTA